MTWERTAAGPIRKGKKDRAFGGGESGGWAPEGGALSLFSGNGRAHLGGTGGAPSEKRGLTGGGGGGGGGGGWGGGVVSGGVLHKRNPRTGKETRRSLGKEKVERGGQKGRQVRKKRESCVKKRKEIGKRDAGAKESSRLGGGIRIQGSPRGPPREERCDRGYDAKNAFHNTPQRKRSPPKKKERRAGKKI